MSEILSASGKTSFGLGKDSLQLSDFERDLAAKFYRPETALLSPDFDRFIGYVVERIIMHGFPLPISQVQGFSAFTANLDTQAGTSTTTSISYADLADGTHPEITGLGPGKYEFAFGAVSNGTGTHHMGVSVNGAAPTSDAEVITQTVGGYWYALVDLTEDSNTLTAKYKGDDGSSVSWRNRYLRALKFANL